jgi:hypothetical protein
VLESVCPTVGVPETTGSVLLVGDVGVIVTVTHDKTPEPFVLRT